VVVPIPYPNIAMKIMAIPGQFNFLIMGFPAHNLVVIIPLTQGDDAGVLLGEMSGTVMGPGEFMEGSTVLIAGGVPATMLGVATMQNSTDSYGFEICPSQFVTGVAR
jgi:hypothetical protein